MNVSAHPHRQDVVREFRARLSPHIAHLAKQSDAVRRQFVPDVRELDNAYLIPDPFESGRDYMGLNGVERIYRDRVVLTPHFDCSAYCRYCFKKTRTLGGSGERDMSDADIDAAIAHIRTQPELRIALITGGDPLRDEHKLFRLLDGLATIPHIAEIRIGTRNLLFDPDRLTDALAEQIAAYSRVDCDNLGTSQAIMIGLSINHPDELSGPVARAVRRLVSRGVTVKGQVTLLREINDDAATLLTLYQRFNILGIQPYYLFHCMPVLGSAHFRTSVARGQQILGELAALSGVYAPTYVYVTQVGKVRVGIDSPLDLIEVDGRVHVRKQTVYRADDFLRYTGREEIPLPHYADNEGRLVALYPDGPQD